VVRRGTAFAICAIAWCGVATTLPAGAQAPAAAVRVQRLLDRPIITPQLDASLGPNIQGPSLIRVPDWISGRLGKYYLYFADHKGRYIRLAYADDLVGPWRVHAAGSLQLAGSYLLTEPPSGPAEELARLRATPQPANLSHDAFTEATTPHIASPDVHVDEANRRIVMYYHGLNALGQQVTRAATSEDGIRFVARPEILGRTYFRAFQHGGYTYAMAMPGQFYRSKDPLSGFEPGPLLFNPNMRHAALLVRGGTLFVFWTQVGHAPETIVLSTIALNGDWMKWSASQPVDVLRPERGRGRGPMRRSCRRSGAPPTATSTSCAIRRCSRRMAGRFSSTRWPARAASPLPK